MLIKLEKKKKKTTFHPSDNQFDPSLSRRVKSAGNRSVIFIVFLIAAFARDDFVSVRRISR